MGRNTIDMDQLTEDQRKKMLDSLNISVGNGSHLLMERDCPICEGEEIEIRENGPHGYSTYSGACKKCGAYGAENDEQECKKQIYTLEWQKEIIYDEFEMGDGLTDFIETRRKV